MKKVIEEALLNLEKSKGISKNILISAINEAMASVYRKKFGIRNIRVEFDLFSKETKIFIPKNVVEYVKDSQKEISVSDAKILKADIKIGDVIETELQDKEKSFSRIFAQIAKQVITQKIREAERNVLFHEFKEKQGDVVTGTVRKISESAIFVEISKAEAILPSREQIKKEKYRIGDRIKVYVLTVDQDLKHSQIVLSRTHPGLIKRLFETEVPELVDGSAKIEKIVREPGVRSKIVISTTNKRLDPIGTLVGVKGGRIQGIIKELRGEKIDIIPYSEDIKEFITLTILPAKAKELIIDEDNKEATIIVDKDQLSLAIGRGGQNIRLAARLCGYKLDVRTKKQYWEQRQISDIPGVSEKIEAILKKKNILRFSDVADLSTDELANIEGIGKTSALKIIEYVKSMEPKEE
ncbi:TPA: transcription termination/antitermination protein NusA [bacterium]|nr:transcription termination/antitermination protein NusA [bacterium]